jgi:hypothetical protein
MCTNEEFSTQVATALVKGMAMRRMCLELKLAEVERAIQVQIDATKDLHDAWVNRKRKRRRRKLALCLATSFLALASCQCVAPAESSVELACKKGVIAGVIVWALKQI